MNPQTMTLLPVYVALVSVLLTYVVTRKLLRDSHPKSRCVTQTIRLEDDDWDGIPEEVAGLLNVMIRYVPSAGRGDSKARMVRIEERLMLGGTPLTNWVEHDEVLDAIAADPSAIERLSVLRLNRAEESVPSSVRG